MPLYASALVGSEMRLWGLTISRWLTGVAPERHASDIAAAAGLAGAHASELDVAGTYSLDQIADAVHHVSRPGKIGTVIVQARGDPRRQRTRRHLEYARKDRGRGDPSTAMD
jgi:hypothetical protein